MGWLAHSLGAASALVGVPVGLVVLAARPEAREGLAERLGRAGPVPPVPPGGVWVHGASVGEGLAALRLVDALAAELPARPVCVSTNTVAGRDVLRARRPALPSLLAPLDHPWCVDAWLSRVQPRALVGVETELWPVRIARARARRLPVVFVSARLSERSLRRYRRLGLARALAGGIDAVGARSDRDAARFAALGVAEGRIRVTGDLKLEPPPEAPRLAPDLAAVLGGVPLVVAASTHEGEETAALEALAAAREAGLAAALVVAPRHPERFDAAADALAAAGSKPRRRRALGAAPLADGDVLLLDSLGELAGLFAHARVAFVGGSLVPRGGHNVLEPVQAGCPVLVGPSLDNVRHVLSLLDATGAVRVVPHRRALGDAVVELLRDPQESRRRALRGREELLAARGAARRSAALVAGVLAEGGG